jgi:peroxin-5
MGATLANNGRSEEAIDAYHKALELRPSFVRARYNIGVSCINIGCYKEAAEHILTGLSMLKRGNTDSEEGVNVSSNSWEMLRKAFIMMVRGRECIIRMRNSYLIICLK